MKNILALAFTTVLATLTVQAQAKPVTIKMQHCGNEYVHSISTNCKNKAASFTLGYVLDPYGSNQTSLTMYNPTSHDIFIDRIELYSRNRQCEIDSWGPDGDTIDAKGQFNVFTTECRPESITKLVFIVGNKRYTYTK
ncbi:hypothetical protein [Acinetobacter rudis]|uniref:hypothetical protein n=1 Tax=Acinetobacter rudis TaxID=632955 RepID=UPI00333F4866